MWLVWGEICQMSSPWRGKLQSVSFCWPVCAVPALVHWGAYVSHVRLRVCVCDFLRHDRRDHRPSGAWLTAGLNAVCLCDLGMCSLFGGWGRWQHKPLTLSPTAPFPNSYVPIQIQIDVIKSICLCAKLWNRLLPTERTLLYNVMLIVLSHWGCAGNLDINKHTEPTITDGTNFQKLEIYFQSVQI